MSDTPITNTHARPMEGFADQWVPRYISEELERELADLREIFPKVLDALGNGSGCLPSCSVEFMREIPKEVRLVVTGLKRELDAERALADRLASVLRTYNYDLLAGEMIQFVPEHDVALAAWKDARRV